jgi:hypothetical protein
MPIIQYFLPWYQTSMVSKAVGDVMMNSFVYK